MGTGHSQHAQGPGEHNILADMIFKIIIGYTNEVNPEQTWQQSLPLHHS